MRGGGAGALEALPPVWLRARTGQHAAAREQYRRIYGLDVPAPAPAAASVRP